MKLLKIINLTKKYSQLIYCESKCQLIRLLLYIRKWDVEIMSFKTKDSISISESTAILEWQIINAYKIKIEGVGTFYNNHGSTIIKTNFKSKTFKLLAFGYNQTIEKEIVIKTIPFTANLKHDAQLKKQANYNVIVKRLTYLKNIDLIEKNLFIKTQKTINFQRLTNENDIVNQIQNIDTSINFN